MRFLSVCSGIEAASCAWEPLGWEAHAFSEIEAFPSAVLAHHYPDIPNWGDMTKFQDWPDADIDLLVGGTPCQSFSVAGLRKGLDDPRGNLALTFLAIASKYSPRWILWENVPGVLSSGQGRDFGAFLGGLGQCGYGWAYRVLDAQHFGIPQRRRRVFVVGHLGDWRRAAAVLFERHSLSGNPAPRREKGQEVAGSLTSRASGGGGGPGAGTDEAAAGYLQAVPSTGDVSHCLNAGGMGRQDYETKTLIASIQERAVSENPDAGPDGAGFRTDGQAYTLEARTVPQAVCFTAKDHGGDALNDLSPTLRAGGHSGSHANAGVMPAVAFMENVRAELRISEQSDALTRGGGKPGQGYAAAMVGSAVRRLTPEECEKLQGFPPSYTLIPYRGKPAADGPRYRALGNSMAVPVMRWIGERIAQVEALQERLEAA